ncbi:MAG: response regulator [Rhodopirellula sp. JB044]|uniref:response regulator n=1 Tax=Rhodopirellula sp. JB044 TaxID=3342844 RepID=UPI00370B9EAB
MLQRNGGQSEVSLMLVEDDPLDVLAMQRTLKKQRILNPLVHARDGMEALDRLRGVGCDPLQRPYLILLDLNMPRMNGLEFLEELRDDPALRDSVVFVLTTSDTDRDIVKAYENFVAGYVLKSKAGEDLLRLLSLLDHYWRIVEFPPPRAASAQLDHGRA